MSLIREGLFAALMVPIGMGHLAVAQEPAATVVGDVSLTAADGHVFPASGVRLMLTCGTERAPVIEISDERGEFRFANASVARCSLVADLQGFKSASARTVTRNGEVTRLDLHLVVEPVYVGVTVTGEPPSRLRSQRRARHRRARHRSVATDDLLEW
jgi:hypothetical protein